MPKIEVYNLKGEKKGALELSPEVFGVALNSALLHQVYVALMANLRSPIAHAKDRSERKGSGKKPFRQKGTGSARQGSVRSPINRGGGVTFGPSKNRNFSKDVPKKMKRKALLTALSGKVTKEALVVVEALELEEKKTKGFASAFKKLALKKNSLLGFAESEKAMMRYARNLAGVKSVRTQDLNVADLLNTNQLVLSRESIGYLEKKYSQAE